MGTVNFNQQAALMAAFQLLETLPPNTRYAIEVTEEDTWEDPSVFNIYVTAKPDGVALARRLSLRTIEDESEHFISYRLGALLISFIEEEDDEREPESDPTRAR